MKFAFALAVSMITMSAMANFDLSKNAKKITCTGADNQTIELSANRTKIKYTVEGESAGANTVTKVVTDNKTYVTYTTSELTLTLKNGGDSFSFTGGNSENVTCK